MTLTFRFDVDLSARASVWCERRLHTVVPHSVALELQNIRNIGSARAAPVSLQTAHDRRGRVARKTMEVRRI